MACVVLSFGGKKISSLVSVGGALLHHLPVIFGKMAFKNGVEHDCEMQ